MICKTCRFSCRQIEKRHNWEKRQCAKCHYLGLQKPYKSSGRPKKIPIKGFN